MGRTNSSFMRHNDMKNCVLFLATGLIPVMAWGQGLVSFSNVGDGVNAPVTNAETGEALSEGWKAQLWAGSSESDLSPVSEPVEFFSSGYFTGGTVAIDSVPPGESPFFQVTAWEGPSVSLAEAQGAGVPWGKSNIFSTPTSPATIEGAPPTPPSALKGLESFTVQTSTGGVIGDFVWADLNRNGLQDEGEPGVGGVEIRVLDCSTSEVLEVVFSDDNGNWALSGDLPAASYLEVSPPEGFSLTAWGVGEDRAADSDIDPFSGRSLCIVTDCGDEDSLCVSVN